MNEIISAYSMNPPNIGLLEDPSIAHKEQSRLCGDTIEVSLKIEEGKVSDYGFTGNMSIITKASASIFGESIIGMSVDDILELDLGYMETLIGEVSPRRKYGATMGLLATRNALHAHLADGIIDDFSDVIPG